MGSVSTFAAAAARMHARQLATHGEPVVYTRPGTPLPDVYATTAVIIEEPEQVELLGGELVVAAAAPALGIRLADIGDADPALDDSVERASDSVEWYVDGAPSVRFGWAVCPLRLS